ncbi:response regulator [Millisia brevis]|uniref:response regulator n=1 Tax=Millisia brevis TaxID=264148 RepID=UPI00082DA798|nr:response regulator transcription factor [Millisia brevis]
MTSGPTDVMDIVLADDHSLFRDGVRRILLDSGSPFRVVGESSSSSGAVRLAGELRPHLLLLDVQIDAGDVVATVAGIRRASPDTAVVMLSMHDSPDLLRRLLPLGIRGYLLKSTGWRELIAALETIRHDPERMVLSISASSALGRGDEHRPELSRRELEVIELAALALSNRQIGKRLNITESTVKRHLHSSFAKLQANSRIDAVNRAAALGLIVRHGM